MGSWRSYCAASRLGPNHAGHSSAGPGLFYLVMLLVTLLMINRSQVIEGSPGTRASVATLGLDPAGVFLGKALALAVELWLTSIVLLAGAVLLLHTQLSRHAVGAAERARDRGRARRGGNALWRAERRGPGPRHAAAGACRFPPSRPCSSRVSAPTPMPCTAAHSAVVGNFPRRFGCIPWYWHSALRCSGGIMIKQLSQRLLGPVTLVLLVLTLWLGLWVTPPDRVQGNLVRLLYVHPAVAWVALYVSFGTSVIAAASTSGSARARS